MYAANFEPLQLLPPNPAAGQAVVSVLQNQTAPGLDQLLADLHAPTPSAGSFPASQFHPHAFDPQLAWLSRVRSGMYRTRDDHINYGAALV